VASGLPYGSVESMARSFGLDEEFVWSWIGELKGARNYAYYFLVYWRWFKEKGYWRSAEEMISEYRKLDEEGREKHVERLKEFVNARKTGSWDRKQAWHAVKNFYSDKLPSTVPGLPTLPRQAAKKLFALSELDKTRDGHKVKLDDDEIRQLILQARMPYQAIFMILSQSGMGLAEFQQFNSKVWQSILDKFNSREPVQLMLYRSKTSTDKRQDYYTLISRDSLNMLKSWLRFRDKLVQEKNVEADNPFCFLTYRKTDRKWVPPTSSQIGEMLTETARRAGLITKRPNGSANRYRFHCHELRDRLRSLCENNKVPRAPAEFFLGHDIDKLRYNKSAWYEPDHFRDEYKKIEHAVNVISNPPKGDLKKELMVSFNAAFLKAFGWSDSELENVDLTKLTEKQLQEKIRQKQRQRRSQEQKPKVRQKVVKIRQLKKCLEDGWEYVEKLPTGEAVIKLASPT